MKNSVIGLFLKIIVVGLITSSIYGLLLQFIFCYLNQSVSGPHLTLTNFVAPLFLTVLMLFVGGYRMLFHNNVTNYTRLPRLISFVLMICLIALVLWQVWYILTWYNIKVNLSYFGKITELLPMVIGLIATIFVAMRIRIKYAS